MITELDNIKNHILPGYRNEIDVKLTQKASVKDLEVVKEEQIQIKHELTDRNRTK